MFLSLGISSECGSTLASFPNHMISCVRRQANVVAHSLTKVITSWPCVHVFNLLPSCIMDSVFNDMK